MKLKVKKDGKYIIKLDLKKGQDSLGNPGWFVDCPTGKFKEIHGFPEYAVQQWLVDRGYSYIVIYR